VRQADCAFLRGLRNGSWPNERFHHRDHVRATYLCLREDGYPGGADAIESLIRNFAAAVGTAEKFHLTLTLAWVRLVAVHVAEDPGRNFEEFIVRCAQLDDKMLPLRHYSRERLFSSEARLAWREPDLRALPVVEPWTPGTTRS
jgi:hypothetical protein